MAGASLVPTAPLLVELGYQVERGLRFRGLDRVPSGDPPTPQGAPPRHLLEIELSQAIGHLHCLWWWVLDYASDGDLGRYQTRRSPRPASGVGMPKRLVEALAACHFLDGDPGSYVIHDWQQYGGRYVQKRTDDKERQRRLARTAQRERARHA